MSKGTDFTGGTDDPMDQTMPLQGLSDLGVTRSVIPQLWDGEQGECFNPYDPAGMLPNLYQAGR
jgi:hypothetical protein